MAGMTDYLENKLIDFLFRGQTFTPPATLYVGLLTAAASDSASGTEVSGGAYARVGLAASLANFAGTQGAGTTAVSSGASGTTSNNGAITYPAPTANWGTIVALGIYDAATGGNLLITFPLAANKVVNSGDAAPQFAAGTLTYQISQ